MSTPIAAQPPGPRRWVFGLGVLIAAALAWGALSIMQDHWRFGRVGVAVEGTMTGSYRAVTSKHVTSYYPGFSYRTTYGHVVLGTVAEAVELADVQRGRRMQLLYDPDDASSVRLAQAVKAGPGILPWILGVLALIVLIPSVWGLATGRPLRLRA